MGGITVHVDRDSVAMGDDVVSHARTVVVAEPTVLSVLLGECAPDIRATGWSWVVAVDGAVAAVWSADHSVRLLVPDRPVHAEDVRDVYFRYFLQMDPEWLHARLAGGAVADREALGAAWGPHRCRAGRAGGTSSRT